MSSYSWCNYCYSTGHKIRKCSKLHSDAADGNPYAIERLEIWAKANEIRKKKIADGDFNCSYCGEKGHRRNKCSALQDDKKTFVNILNEFRKERESLLDSYGMGKGALILAQSKGWDGKIYEENNLISLGWMENTVHPLRDSANLSVYVPKTGKRGELSVPNPLKISEASNALERVTSGWTKIILVPKKKKLTTFSSDFSSCNEKTPLVRELFASNNKHELSLPRRFKHRKNLIHSLVYSFNSSYLRGEFT